MIKHKRFGFTIVELMVVIVAIGLLVGISAIAYRETQKNARDERRKIDAAMLRAAVEDYYADNGDYPKPECAGGASECWNNEAWQALKDGGYIKNIPQPGSEVTAGGNPVKYGWLYASPSSYGIYIPLESGACKTGKDIQSSWWSSLGGASIPVCDF